MKLNAAKPKDANYPLAIVSIGDHIRARRIELGLLHKQVAACIGVTVSAVLNWEKNRSSPSLRFLPKIIEFLGYDPAGSGATRSLSERLKGQRRTLGLSRRRLAALLGIDESNLTGWETGKHLPTKKSLERLSGFLSSNLDT